MKPAAKLGDDVFGLDTHIVLVSSPAGPVPTPIPSPFQGKLIDGLAASVFIDDKPVATESSAAVNVSPHVPAGGPFQNPPKNRGKVMLASTSVFIEDKGVARAGDIVNTCKDLVDATNGVMAGESTVFVGD